MQWKWQTIVMGSAFLAILLLTRQIVSSNLFTMHRIPFPSDYYHHPHQRTKAIFL
jgi:hypothetical protein